MTYATAKHRMFAQHLADGLSQEAAYKKAGFTGKGAGSSASTLLKKNPNISKWRDEILAERAAVASKAQAAAINHQVTEKARTLNGLIDDLYRIKDMAMAAEPVLDSQGNPTGEYRPDNANAIKAAVTIGQQLFGAFVAKSQAIKPGIEAVDDEDLIRRAQEAATRLGVKLPKITLQ